MQRSEPGAVAGSALGVFPVAVLQMKFKHRSGDFKGGAARLREDKETDTVNAPKYVDPLMGISQLAGGTISIATASGEFSFGSSGPKPTSGAMYLNQAKSMFTSTSGTTTLGTPTIKTLTGLLLNPFSVFRPSTAITPHRGWMASLFPSLSRFNMVDWVVTAAVQVLFFQALALLFQEQLDDPSKPAPVRKDRKDLGTLIIDNQDYELMILNGEI